MDAHKRIKIRRTEGREKYVKARMMAYRIKMNEKENTWRKTGRPGGRSHGYKKAVICEKKF